MRTSLPALLLTWHAWCICRVTYEWIKSQIESEAKEKGVDVTKYAKSAIVQTSAPVELGSLRKADGEEGFD